MIQKVNIECLAWLMRKLDFIKKIVLSLKIFNNVEGFVVLEESLMLFYIYMKICRFYYFRFDRTKLKCKKTLEVARHKLVMIEQGV